jgi:hypothetical protein
MVSAFSVPKAKRGKNVLKQNNNTLGIQDLDNISKISNI